MDNALWAVVFLLGLTVSGAQDTTTTVTSSASSSGSDPQTSDAESLSAVITTLSQDVSVGTMSDTQSLSASSSPSPLSLFSTEESSSASSVSVPQTSESHTEQGRPDTATNDIPVSTVHEQPVNVSFWQGSGAESSSVLDQPRNSVTRGAAIASMPTTVHTREGTMNSGAGALENTTLDMSSTTETVLVSREHSVTTPAQAQRSSSSPRPLGTSHNSSSDIDSEADVTSVEVMTTTEHSDDHTTPLHESHVTHSEAVQPVDSVSSATSLASDVVSTGQSVGDVVRTDHLSSSFTPTWEVMDFSMTTGIGTTSLSEATSFYFMSTLSSTSEFWPEITQNSFGLSVSSEDYTRHIVSSTASSSVVLKSSASEEESATEHLQSTAGVWTTSDAAELKSTQSLLMSSSVIPSSSWLDSQHTDDTFTPSQTVVIRSDIETSATISATSSIPMPSSIVDTQHGSLETLMISPSSSLLFPVTPTESVDITSSSTPVTEVTPAPTSTKNVTSTPTTTTTVKTTQPAKRDVRYLLTLTGDCHLILNNTEFFQRFLAGFHDLIVKQLRIAEDTYRLGEITCGSVRVYVTFLHVTMPDFDIMIQSIIRNGGRGLAVPVWIDSHFATFDLVHAKHVPLAPDEHTFNIVTQVMDDVDIIVIIVACCVCGVLIAIGIAICVKECYRRKHVSAFNLLDVPHVDLKMEDFTLTRIPRPKPIYQEVCSDIPTKTQYCDGDVIYADIVKEASNGHATKSCSTSGLHPSDMHLRIKEHSDGIIVGVTASACSPHVVSYSPRQSGLEQGDSYSNGTATRRSKLKTRTPSGEGEGESQASECLLAAHHQGVGDEGGSINPVFVHDQDDQQPRHDDKREAL